MFCELVYSYNQIVNLRDGKLTTQANSQYKTNDSAVASYLIQKGLTPEIIDYSQPDAVIVFANPDKSATTLANNYLTSTANADVATFHRINRALVKIIKRHLQWGDISG